MTVAFSFFPGARNQWLALQLPPEVLEFCSHLFAESTKKTYKTHRDTFLCFCKYMGYSPGAIQTDHLLQYVAFLARGLKASLVRSYLNIVGLLHKEFGLPTCNPLLHNWPLNWLLTDINRSKGLTPNQSYPWATCLVAFYGMFRKSHLLRTAANHFNPSKQLTKAEFKTFIWGTLVSIRWSKTIQFCERVVEIPLPSIPGSALCPMAAITNAFRFTAPESTQGSQAFNWVDGSCVAHVFTYSAFVSKLHSHLSILGMDPKLYAGHSFCRGVPPLPINLVFP